MGSHLSALTSCATSRTASITLTSRGTDSESWTRSTHHLVSHHPDSIDSLYAPDTSEDASFVDDELWSPEYQASMRRGLVLGERGGDDESALAVDEGGGREKASSTTTSLQRDFDGEGYKEEVDSIADLIDVMHRDFLQTTTTTTDSTKRPPTSGSASTRKLSREMSRRSVKTQSGKWDSSVDEIISDIFERIYGIKRVS